MGGFKLKNFPGRGYGYFLDQHSINNKFKISPFDPYPVFPNMEWIVTL